MDGQRIDNPQTEDDPEGRHQADKHRQHTLEVKDTHIGKTQQKSWNKCHKAIMEHRSGRYQGKNKKDTALGMAVLEGSKQRHQGHRSDQAQQCARIEGHETRRIGEHQQEKGRDKQPGHRAHKSEHFVQRQHDASRSQQTQQIDGSRYRASINQGASQREEEPLALNGRRFYAQ